MVQRKRTYKRRAYKKRTYKRRYYKRRYYKRRYAKPIKKPEINIIEYNYNNIAFNASNGVGYFNQLTNITSAGVSDIDNIEYIIDSGGVGKKIDGKKIRLKYLYIKGYIKIASTSDADDFNCKLMVFRWKRNTNNSAITWNMLVNNPPNGAYTAWTEDNRLDMMYKQDWKNDIKINFYRKVKNLYRKYDDANNIIPFKIRVPLYDCVLSCDNYKNTTDNLYYAQSNPSTNGLYFTFLSNKYDNTTTINYKCKLYYTDY